MSMQKCDIIAEALIDVWEGWQLEDQGLFAKLQKFLNNSNYLHKDDPIQVYIAATRLVERYLGWRKRQKALSRAGSEGAFIDQLTSEISHTAFQYFVSCVGASHQQKLIFSLWTEGMKASHMALFLDIPSARLEEEIEKLKTQIKRGVTRGL